MDSAEFKRDFLEDIKTAAQVIGEGSSATFVQNVADYLIDAEVLSDFNPAFYKDRFEYYAYRVDGYAYDELDKTMSLIIADFDGCDPDRSLTNKIAEHDFSQLQVFIRAALTSDLHEEIEPSTECADLVDLMRSEKKNIRKYRLYIFTDAVMSSRIKSIELESYCGIPVEGQIWDLDRLYTVCCYERENIEIDFTDYCENGIPCLEASTAPTEKFIRYLAEQNLVQEGQDSGGQYTSYLGVVPGSVLADIYDKYGSRLLEGNVRSFLTTKVAVNKKIRNTILKMPEMFFAFNNGISATAKEITVENTGHGSFITFARDLQIINGGQTTASIANARYKDKADLDGLYVQMKLTVIDNSAGEEGSDQLIQMISRSSNSQNKVSDADFFASHPFHKRMEQISNHVYAPAKGGNQYGTRWFYERARGQYLQKQMFLTPAKKKAFKSQNPKDQVIQKIDLAKVQNTWLGHPDIVSKGAQTNFASFADYIDAEWKSDNEQFNELYFKKTAALLLIFHDLEKAIPRQYWYKGGYRANIIYYTVALFRKLTKEQFPKTDLDLMRIWNMQYVPETVEASLIALAEIVHSTITDENRPVANVTQYCKRAICWQNVQKISFDLPEGLQSYLISTEEQKAEQKSAIKERKIDDDIDAQSKVVCYKPQMWKRLEEFAVEHHLAVSSDITALSIAQRIPSRIPNTYQSKRLLALLRKAIDDGFSTDA